MFQINLDHSPEQIVGRVVALCICRPESVIIEVDDECTASIINQAINGALMEK